MTIRLLHVAVQPVLISASDNSVAPTSSLSASQLAEFETVGVVVQPVLVLDDGNTLSPGPQTQPRTLTAEQFAAFVHSLPAEIAALNEAEGADG